MGGVPARRRILPADGQQALAVWRAAGSASGSAAPSTARPAISPATVATAVRFTLEELAERAPGRTLEVRVPPYGAVQCVEGPRHTRGTPPNVIEMDAGTWLGLVTGQVSWAEALASGAVHASGQRASLADYLPLVSD